MGKQAKESYQEMPAVAAYAVVPSKDDEQHQGTDDTATVVTAVVDQPNPIGAGAVPNQYQHLPEAQGLTWRDEFFEDHPTLSSSSENGDIVAVFDLDYESMEAKYKCASWTCLGVWSVCCPSVIPWLLIGLVPCHVNKNVRWNVRSQHVALTTKGLLLVQDERPACWGESCCSVAKRTKFVPYSQLAECNVQDGGWTKTCTIDTQSLSKVKVCTSTSNCHDDAMIVGLENPHGFAQLAMALKRQHVATPMNMQDRMESAASAVVANAGETNQEVAELLREIRDELRRSNSSAASPPVAEPVHPSAPSAQD
mmetsp:Transcript_24389/g.67558  ORF Transcript_24389/g.67558 Transcript_24389/m.67558 type:complete len:310 (+) Transcript_24389:81-1010(+)